MSIVTNYPSWYILLCLLAGAGCTWLLYRRAPLLKEAGAWWGRTLVVSRFLVISLLAFLLLGPMLRTVSREVEKPIVLVAVDESASILNAPDSMVRKERITADIRQLQEGLGDDYDLRLLAFGDRVRTNPEFAFRDRATDFSKLYDQVDVQFSNRNTGALILATDGLFNEGASPVYGPEGVKVPVYSIALGDTIVRKDLYISSVQHNRIAFLGNTFPIEIAVDARQASGAQTLLTVEQDSQPVFSRTLQLTGNTFHVVVPVLAEARSKGIHHFRITVSAIEGEVTTVNNVRDIFIEVVEQKEKILLLAGAPHPDISALRQTLEKSPNHDVTVSLLRDFSGSINAYNVVVLHGIPGAGADGKELLVKLKESDVSVWFILGSNTLPEALNAAESGVRISQANGQLNEVQATPAAAFGLFTVSPEWRNQVSTWPPLKAPFGVYQATAGIYTLLYQKVGAVVTSQPLLAFADQNGKKTALLAGEGLWRWKLAEFSENGSHLLTDEFINSVVQYLSVKENRSPFRLSAKNNFRENESVQFDARLFNQSGQLTNTPEVRLVIRNAGGKEFPFIMTRTENAYHLEAGVFPVGNYSYKAETKLGEMVFTRSGEFSVSPLQLETAVTVADHGLLKTLAAKTGGRVVYPGQMQALITAVKADEQLKPVSYMNKKLEDLLKEPWFFALLMVFLCLEWFIRKRAGSY